MWALNSVLGPQRLSQCQQGYGFGKHSATFFSPNLQGELAVKMLWNTWKTFQNLENALGPRARLLEAWHVLMLFCQQEGCAWKKKVYRNLAFGLSLGFSLFSSWNLCFPWEWEVEVCPKLKVSAASTSSIPLFLGWVNLIWGVWGTKTYFLEKEIVKLWEANWSKCKQW